MLHHRLDAEERRLLTTDLTQLLETRKHQDGRAHAQLASQAMDERNSIQPRQPDVRDQNGDVAQAKQLIPRLVSIPGKRDLKAQFQQYGPINSGVVQYTRCNDG